MGANMASLLIALSFAITAYCQSSKRLSEVIGCDQQTYTQPGVGYAFRGYVADEGYAFSVRIPDKLTGWGGVAPGAPFHGFTIFLDAQRRACIYFEVHIRVDEEDAPRSAANSMVIHLGRAEGWQTIRRGIVGKVSITNVTTIFSFRRPNRTDDGKVLLITPTANLRRAKARYDEFIRSLKFGESAESGQAERGAFRQ